MLLPMFENLVNQDIKKIISSDIESKTLPGALLYSGPEACGKLTAGLETARILSCHNNPQGKWQCQCPSCMQHKSLINSNLMLLGPRDCSLEICAAKETFLNALSVKQPYLDAARYLFLRSIRKLTLRFNGILWQGSKDLNKIGSLIEDINENLELLDFPRQLPSFDECTKVCDKLEKLALKLEDDFLYDSIPVDQIRNMEEWAHIKSEEGKKTVIIENADRMALSVRNALLKILEEPPADCQFILLTSKKNAIMQTILSRVRCYNFSERSLDQQNNVITRVFHKENANISINDFLLTYLPVPPQKIKEEAQNFYDCMACRQIPDSSEIIKNCGNFNPRLELKLFLNYLAQFQRKIIYSQNGCEASAQCMEVFRQCWDNITLYNQSLLSAFEILVRDMSAINVSREGVFKQ